MLEITIRSSIMYSCNIDLMKVLRSISVLFITTILTIGWKAWSVNMALVLCGAESYNTSRIFSVSRRKNKMFQLKMSDKILL